MSSMTDDQPMAARQTESDIMRQVNGYDQMVSRLRETLGLLEDKLSSVLVNEDGNSEKASAPSTPNKSTLAELINNLNERLYYCVKTVDTLIQRVDL